MRLLIKFYLGLLGLASGGLLLLFTRTDYASLAQRVRQPIFVLGDEGEPLAFTPGRYGALQLALAFTLLLALVLLVLPGRAGAGPGAGGWGRAGPGPRWVAPGAGAARFGAGLVRGGGGGPAVLRFWLPAGAR